jgi:hypothetical protein
MPSGSVAPRCVPSASRKRGGVTKSSGVRWRHRRCSGRDAVGPIDPAGPCWPHDDPGDRRTDLSSVRRAEIGQHHHISGNYLGAYAGEMAWKEDNRRVANGTQHTMATGAALAHPVSRAWCGYWQR